MMNSLTGGQRLRADCQVLIWLCRVLGAFWCPSSRGACGVVPFASQFLVPAPVLC